VQRLGFAVAKQAQTASEKEKSWKRTDFFPPISIQVVVRTANGNV